MLWIDLVAVVIMVVVGFAVILLITEVWVRGQEHLENDRVPKKFEDLYLTDTWEHDIVVMNEQKEET